MSSAPFCDHAVHFDLREFDLLDDGDECLFLIIRDEFALVNELFGQFNPAREQVDLAHPRLSLNCLPPREGIYFRWCC